MYAISSAGVAFAVTRACSSGELEKCGCDRTVHGVSPQGKCGRWGGHAGQGQGQGPGPRPSLTRGPRMPTPRRLPVVGMLGQHRLRRGLLTVICGRAGEEQGGLVQPGPHEPPQQRGRQEGSARGPSTLTAGRERAGSAMSPDALPRPPAPQKTLVGLWPAPGTSYGAGGTGRERTGKRASQNSVSGPQCSTHVPQHAPAHTYMCTQVCLHPSLSRTHPPISSRVRISPCHCEDRVLNYNTICYLSTYSSRFLCRFNAAIFFPNTSLFTVSYDTAL